MSSRCRLMAEARPSPAQLRPGTASLPTLARAGARASSFPWRAMGRTSGRSRAMWRSPMSYARRTTAARPFQGARIAGKLQAPPRPGQHPSRLVKVRPRDDNERMPLVGLLVLVAGLCLGPMAETDLFFRLRIGQEILATGAL